MRARKLSSDAIERAAYDAERQVLHLWFRGGARYRYADVPRGVFEALARAPSPARYFADFIRGCYPCTFDPERKHFKPAAA